MPTKTPPASWHTPSAILFTSSDPDQAAGKRGVGTTLLIADTGDGRPDWVTADGSGCVYQDEGSGQEDRALARIEAELGKRGLVNRGLVTTLGLDPAPFVALGVTSCFVECYAQAGDHPYGNIRWMSWQAKHDGWPHVVPVLGVYGAAALSHYLDLNGGAHNFAGPHWLGGPLAIYLAEGMSDTGSWGTLAALTH
jgi:hypothetical protein